MTWRSVLVLLALTACVTDDGADADEDGLTADGRVTLKGAREPQRRAIALHDYVMAARAGTVAYSSAGLLALTSDPRWVLPAANTTKFEPAALTSLRHAVPSTLS